MEALIILIAEILFAPVVACVTLAGNVFAVFASFIIEIILGLCGMTYKKPKKHKAELPKDITTPEKIHAQNHEDKAIIRKPSGSLRLIKRISLAFLAIVVSALLLVNFIFFEPTVQWLVAKVEQKTGIELSVDKISGNIFSGKIAFHNLKIKRNSDIKSSFDLKVEDVSIDINIASLIFSPITLESLFVQNVTGSIKQPDVKKGAKNKNPKKIKTKRIFVVEDLSLKDINIVLSKGTNSPVTVSLSNITSAPFRSNYAIFDVFFRSNVSGSINGHDISISTQEIDSGRATKWDITDLPVSTVSDFVGKPPISWFKDGTMDIKVEDQWQLNQKANIEMDWRFQMKGVKVQVPLNAGFVERTLAMPIANYINNKKEDVDIRFALVMNEHQFEGASSLDASGIWDALIKSMIKAIAPRTNTKVENVKKGLGGAVKGLKGFLKKKQK